MSMLTMSPSLSGRLLATILAIEQHKKLPNLLVWYTMYHDVIHAGAT